MASFQAVGGVRKKLTLQTKKRYQLSSSASAKQPSCDEKSKPPPATRYDDALRKRLYSYCIPTSNVVPPLPASTLTDVKTEAKLISSTLPPPNFKLLTRRSFAPLDLKKCPNEPVIVIDDDTSDTVVKNQLTHKQRVGVPVMQHGRTSHVAQKGVGRAHNARVIQTNTCTAPAAHQRSTTLKNNGHYTQLKPSFLTSGYLQQSHKHESSSSALSHKTSKSHSVVSTTVGGQASKASTHKVQGCRKCMWSEVNDDDDEFDELCQMVDLSNSLDEPELQVVMTTESNKAENTWTCPMCNQVFTGRSAEDHENHLVQCLAMDVV